jgi:hypothetical protein
VKCPSFSLRSEWRNAHTHTHARTHTHTHTHTHLDLVPAVIEAHGHGADEGLDARVALVVACTEAPPHVLVIQHLRAWRERPVLVQREGAC